MKIQIAVDHIEISIFRYPSDTPPLSDFRYDTRVVYIHRDISIYRHHVT